MMAEVIQASGPTVDELIQTIADAISDAYDKGMDLNQALSMVAIVATDVGRAQFGEDYVDVLCETVSLRKNQPLPNTETAPIN
jgi:hypothetical protein